MNARLEITALRDCHIRLKRTHENNKEISDRWVELRGGERLTDFLFVMALDPDQTDLPDEHRHLSEAGLQDVRHPDQSGKPVESYGVLLLRLVA